MSSGMSTSRALCPCPERLLYQANPSEMFREKERRMVKTCPCSSKTGAELADLPSPFSLHRAGHIVISQSFRFICVRKRLLKYCSSTNASLRLFNGPDAFLAGKVFCRVLDVEGGPYVSMIKQSTSLLEEVRLRHQAGVAHFRSFELPFDEVRRTGYSVGRLLHKSNIGMNEEEKDISVSPLSSESI